MARLIIAGGGICGSASLAHNSVDNTAGIEPEPIPGPDRQRLLELVS